MKDRLVIVIPFATILLIFGIKLFFENKKETDDFKLYTNKTEGTVIDYRVVTEPNGKHDWTYRHYLIIQYEINGEKYSTKKDYAIKKIRLCNIGDTIELLYKKDNPKEIIPKFYIEYKTNETDRSKIYIIFFPLVAFIFLGIMPELKNSKIYEQN